MLKKEKKMEFDEYSEKLIDLDKKIKELSEEMDELKNSMALEMDVEDKSSYSYKGYSFVRQKEDIRPRVDHRLFYELTCQSQDVSEETLQELTESCTIDQTTSQYLSIRPPRD
jgi:hypothetical protein